MNRYISAFVFLFFAAFLGGVWWTYVLVFSKDTESETKSVEQKSERVSLPDGINKVKEKSQTDTESVDEEKDIPSDSSVSEVPSKGVVSDSGDFPSPSTEVVNGVTERTIHIGVRQWAWDPATITAKQGELVRLVVHNADVKHGLVIPDLGVDQDIPPDGAVIKFMASKAGTFEFLCSLYCGEGHAEMAGKIIIE